MRIINQHIHRLLEQYRMLGFKKMLWVIPLGLVRSDYLKGAIDLRLPLPEIPVHESMRWTSLTREEAPKVQAINPSMSEAEVRRRLGEGQECLLYWIEGSLVHYRWFTKQPAYFPYLGKTVCPQEGDLLSSGSFTHPAFRRRGIASYSFISMLHRARDQGSIRNVGIMDWWNTISFHAHWENTPFTLVGTIGYWNVGLRKIYFTTGDVSLDERGNVFAPPIRDIPVRYD